MTLGEKLFKLKRNDLQGALKLYREGATSPDQVNWMRRLQSDPTEFDEAVVRLQNAEQARKDADWNEDDDDQPRDENGRWTSGGGGGGGAKSLFPSARERTTTSLKEGKFTKLRSVKTKSGQDVEIYGAPNGSYSVHLADNLEEIGTAYLATNWDDPKQVYHDYLSIVRIDPKYRRQGIGKNLYQAIEAHTGKPLRPSPIDQSEDAKAFWAARTQGSTGEGGRSEDARETSAREAREAMAKEPSRKPLGTDAPDGWKDKPVEPGSISVAEGKAKVETLREKLKTLSDWRETKTVENEIKQTLQAAYQPGSRVPLTYDNIDAITRPGHVYRGMEPAEYDATVGRGQGVLSRNDYSVKSLEGTSFGYDAGTASSYVNAGRSHPMKTGKPNYIVEVRGGDHLTYNGAAGYPQSARERAVPQHEITRVWKVEYEGDGNGGPNAAYSHEGLVMQEIPPPSERTDEWNEEDHPRDEGGRFGSGGGGGKEKAPEHNGGRRPRAEAEAIRRANDYGDRAEAAMKAGNDEEAAEHNNNALLAYAEFDKLKQKREAGEARDRRENREAQAKKELYALGDRAIAAEEAGNKEEAEKIWAEADKVDKEWRALKEERFRSEIAEAAEAAKTKSNEEADREYKRQAAREYHRTISDPDNIRDLATRKIVESKPLGGGANVTKLVTLDNGNKAVWKPASGEEHFLRSNVTPGTYYAREAAASEVARIIGVEDLVPAVTTSHYEGSMGSLHAWVEGTPLNKAPLTTMFDREAAERMRVFDYITGNSDRHRGNVLVREFEGKQMPVLIDNGLSFPNGSPERFIQPTHNIPNEPLSKATHDMIAGIDDHKLAATLAEAGIEKEAARHTIMRSLRVKRQKDALDSTPGATENHWDYEAVKDLSTSRYKAADAIVERAYADQD